MQTKFTHSNKMNKNNRDNDDDRRNNKHNKNIKGINNNTKKKKKKVKKNRKRTRATNLLNKSSVYKKVKALTNNPENSFLTTGITLKKWNSPGSTFQYWTEKLTQFRLKIMEQGNENLIDEDFKNQFHSDRINLQNLIQSGFYIDDNGNEVETLRIYPPSREYAKTILNLITLPDGHRRKLKIVSEMLSSNGDRERIGVVVNNSFLNSLFHYQDNGKVDKENEHYEDAIAKLLRAEFMDFSIITIKEKTRKKVRGGFFQYKHNTKLNLKDLQIYKNERKNTWDNKKRKPIKLDSEQKNFDDGQINCLIHTLKYYGFSENDLIRASKYIVNGTIAKSKIKDLATHLSVGFDIKEYLPNKKSNNFKIWKYNKKCKKRHMIGLAIGHYFPIKQIQVTSFALKNYDKIKGYKEWYKLDSVNKKGLYKRRNNKFLSSENVVRVLLENKDKLLTQINTAELMKYSIKDYDNSNISPVKEKGNNLVYREKQKEWSDVFCYDTESIPFGTHQGFCGSLSRMNLETGKMEHIATESRRDYLIKIFEKLPPNKIKEVFKKKKKKKKKKKANKVKDTQDVKKVKDIIKAKYIQDIIKAKDIQEVKKIKDMNQAKDIQEVKKVKTVNKVTDEEETKEVPTTIISEQEEKEIFSAMMYDSDDEEPATIISEEEAKEGPTTIINKQDKKEIFSAMMCDSDDEEEEEEEEEEEKREEVSTLKKLPHLIYVHNLKYDFSFLREHINGKATICKSGGKLIQVTGIFFGRLITFRDSYSMIDKPLRKFGKMFGIKIEKDVMPYNAYDSMKTVNQKSMTIRKALKNLPKEEDKKQFMKNLEKLDLMNNKKTHYDHIAYCEYYCRKDVEVLGLGLIKFREMMTEVTDLDTFQYLTAPSISHDYFTKEGCYEGCKQLSGITRDYIQKTVVGGRCMMRKNEKQYIDCREDNDSIKNNDAISLNPQNKIFKYNNEEFRFKQAKYKILNNVAIKAFLTFCDDKGCKLMMKEIIEILNITYYDGIDDHRDRIKIMTEEIVKEMKKNGKDMIKNQVYKSLIQDYDGCSLYPSAMERIGKMGGYLKGNAIPFTGRMKLKTLNKKDGYYIKINIKNIPKERDFPVISKVYDNRRNWVNTIRGEFYIDHITLADLMEFHGLEERRDFDILEGYIFNSGRNPKILEVIQRLYNTRREKKKEGNPIQEIFKLLMNSAYGKTIQKPINSTLKIVNSTEELDNLIRVDHNRFREFVKIKDTDKYIINFGKETQSHQSLPQIGSEILAMSKRIMNEVMYLAEDLGLPIYYQDTDSMHIKQKNLDILIPAYKEKYGRELDGKNMGQFHSDFDDFNGKKALGSQLFIACGKKMYIDEIVYPDEQPQYHIRMKGVPKKVIEYRAKELNETITDVYSNLFKGKTYEFDLAKYQDKGVCSFEFSKEMGVKTRTKFIRTIKC